MPAHSSLPKEIKVVFAFEDSEVYQRLKTSQLKEAKRASKHFQLNEPDEVY